MRADLALILFVLTLAGGIALLVLRKKRGGAPLLIGGIVLLVCAAALALYLAAADAVIPNNGTLDDALHAAMEALDEIFDS